MNETLKRLGEVVLKLGKAAVTAALANAAANQAPGKRQPAKAGAPEIFNPQQNEAFFKGLQGLSNKQKLDSAVDSFHKTMKLVLQESETPDDDLYANFMNFQFDAGLVQNSDPALKWNIPYDCRMAGYRKLMAQDWPGLSKKFKDPAGIKKGLEEGIGETYELSAAAQACFGVKNDRDKVEGLGN